MKSRFIPCRALVMLAMICATALPAHACELVCMRTTTLYDGAAVGGLAGADAKCAAEFPGFRFMRNASILEGVRGACTDQTTALFAWAAAQPGQGAVAGNSNNCASWVSNSNAVKGVAALVYCASNRTVSGVIESTCDTARSLYCCNI